MATAHVREPHRTKRHRAYEYVSGHDNDTNSAFEIWMQPHHFYPRYDSLTPVFFPDWLALCLSNLALPACLSVCLFLSLSVFIPGAPGLFR